MAEHRATSLQLLDVIENEIHDYDYSIFGISRSILRTIPNLFNMIYPADGVDNIKQTINGSHEAFHSAYGNNFRKDSLTKLSSFLGLPNRQLHIESSQSIRNLLENFSGGFGKKSDTTNAIMIPLNIVLTSLRFLLNIVKLITEFAPGLLLVTVIILMMKIFKGLENPTENILRRLGISHHYLDKNILAGLGFVLIFPLILTSALLYLGGCCLTSSYESMKAAWHFGAEVIGKDIRSPIWGFVFLGIVIATTIVVNIFALPWAVKFLVAYALPRITPVLPQFIVNGIEKLGAIIKPVLTVVGNALAPIIKYSQFMLPEFVGAGLFGTIIRSLISPIVNYGFDKIQEWWNYNPEFDVKSEIDILSQQSKMLCDLGASQEEQPALELHEAPNIINGYLHHEEELQLNPMADNPSQPLLDPGSNNSPQPVEGSREEINSTASDYSLKPPSAASSSLFPPVSSLKPAASSGQSQTSANVVERDSQTPSPRAQ